MFPYISDLINNYLGTSLVIHLYTFGTIVALAFGVGFFIVYIELKRKESEGRIPVESSKLISGIILITVLSSFAGMRFFHILDHWDSFLENPVKGLLSSGGLSFYGGLVFGIVALYFYIRRKNIPPVQVLDIAAPALLIGYAVGRMACHWSGDGCWGIENPGPKPEWLAFLPDWAWGCRYPHNILNKGFLMGNYSGVYCHILYTPVFPTSIYESFMALIAFIILWTIRKKTTIPGCLFSIFLIYYSTSRFFIEFIRVNPKYSFLGMNLSQSQYISVICFLLGVASIWYFRRLSMRQGISPG